jgi:hypothetical protein
MKRFSLLLAAVAGAMLGCEPTPDAKEKNQPKQEPKPEAALVTVRQADTLDPDELGIEKFVFQEKVPAGKVMVLRRTEERNGRKVGGVYETIQYTNGGTARQVVLVYDLLRFPFGDRQTKGVRIREPGHSLEEFSDLRVRGTAIAPGRLQISLTDFQKKNVELIFECFVEDHKAAKARIPGLSAATPNETWTYCKQFDEK